MRSIFHRLSPMLFAASLLAPVFTTGCTVHAGVYDPYYHDHHVWVTEQPYYSQWERDTHRDHEDFARRNATDQKEYWDWRHKQEDHH